LDKGQTAQAVMVDATPLELAAMRSCLKFFGEAASAIGFDQPLGAYSEAQALSVIQAIVTGYVEQMAAQHERTKFPSVRMALADQVNDPMRDKALPLAENPFADMEDDLPWLDSAGGRP
jgi:hypothetical protein